MLRDFQDTPFPNARPSAAAKTESRFMQEHGRVGAVAIYRCVVAVGDAIAVLGTGLRQARPRKHTCDRACGPASPIPR